MSCKVQKWTEKLKRWSVIIACCSETQPWLKFKAGSSNQQLTNPVPCPYQVISLPPYSRHHQRPWSNQAIHEHLVANTSRSQTIHNNGHIPPVLLHPYHKHDMDETKIVLKAHALRLVLSEYVADRSDSVEFEGWESILHIQSCIST